MSTQQLSAGTTVAQLLEDAPASSAVLNRYGTACVGCPFARFCTLTDVSRTYGLTIESFLADLLGSTPAESSMHQELNRSTP